MRAGISLISLSVPTKGGHSGESLVLRRDGESSIGKCGDTYVVDLGLSSDLGRQAAVAAPSIVVLTHDDEDHIGGWDGFAEVQDRVARKINQLWVPAEWGYLAVCALQIDQDSKGVHGNVVLDADVAKDLALALDLADMKSLWPQEEYMAVFSRGGDSEGPNPEVLNKLVAVLDGSRDEILERFRDIEEHLSSKERSWMSEKANLPKSSTSAARTFDRWKHLCKILTWCGKNNVRVRFFSTRLGTHAICGAGPEPWRTAGIAGKLTVANAAEVDPGGLVVKDPLRVAYYVSQLTAQNRLSLTPYLQGNLQSGEMDIMVWSDSAGESVMGKKEEKTWSIIPWWRIGAMTAPHHGSTNIAHDLIWEARAEECKLRKLFRLNKPPIAVVVAGTKRESGVHPAFRLLPEEARTCNRCRHVKKPKSGRLAMVSVSAPGVTVFPPCHVDSALTSSP